MIVALSPSEPNDPLFTTGDIFQVGYARILKTAGESVKYNVFADVAGKHNIYVRARANTSETILNKRTYSLKVNGTSVVFVLKPETVSPYYKDYFGGASWGDYFATAVFKEGLNTIEITTHGSYGGIDYVEYLPENEQKTYTESQLKSPEMATWLSKMLGLYDKADLDKAVLEARQGYYSEAELTAKITEATKGLMDPLEVSKLINEAKEGLFTDVQVNQKISEVKDSLPMLIQQAVEAKTPIIQTQAIETYKSKLINIIEQS